MVHDQDQDWRPASAHSRMTNTLTEEAANDAVAHACLPPSATARSDPETAGSSRLRQTKPRPRLARSSPSAVLSPQCRALALGGTAPPPADASLGPAGLGADDGPIERVIEDDHRPLGGATLLRTKTEARTDDRLEADPDCQPVDGACPAPSP